MASSTATINLQVVMGGNGTSGLNALGAGFGRTASSAMGLWQMLEIGRLAMESVNTSAEIARQTFEGFSGVLNDAITAGGNMEFSMVRAGIAIKGGTQDAQDLQASIIDLADSGLYSTQQVADGFVQLGRKGQDATEIINDTGAAMVYLAESIGSDTVPAATLLATNMETFNLKASDAMDTANLLTGAFYASGDSVEQLQQALNMAGAEAHLMKIPFSDFLETIVLLSQAGLRGSQAGASLRYMLASIADPASKAQEELAALGLIVINNNTPAFKNFAAALQHAADVAGTTAPKYDGTLKSLSEMFDKAKSLGVVHTDLTFFEWATQAGLLSDKMFTANGQFVGMKQALDNIKQALDKFPPSDVRDRAAALGQLFNVRSGQGAQLLTGIEDLDQKWNTLNGDLKNTSAVKDAEKLTDTWNGSVQRLQTTFNSFMAFIGNNVTPTLKPFIDQLNGILADVMKNHPEWLKWAGVALLLGTAVSGVAMVLGGLIAGLVTLIVFITPLTMLFGLAASIVLAFVNVLQHGQQWVKGFGLLFQSMGTVVHNVVTSIGNLFGLLGTKIGQGLGLVGKFWGDTWHRMQVLAQMTLAAIPILFHRLVAFIGGIVHGAWNAVVNFFINGIHRIGDFFGWLYNHNYYWQALVDTIRKVVQSVVTWLQNIWKTVTTDITNAWHFIQVSAALVWGAVTTTIQTQLTNAQKTISSIWNNITGFLGGVWKGISTTAQNLWHGIVSHVQDALSQVWKTISGAAGSATHAVQTGVVNPIQQKIQELINNAKKWGEHVIQMFADAIRNGAGKIFDAAKQAAGGLAKVLGFHSPAEEGPGKDADTWAPNFIRMFAGGIVSGVSTVAGAGSAVASGLANSFSGHSAGSLANGVRGIGSVGANGVTIPIYLDSNLIAQAFFNLTTGQLQTQGAARLFR